METTTGQDALPRVFGQPVYGPGEHRFVKRYLRTYRVIQSLARIDFDSCVDVGASEGYTSALVEGLFGASCLSADGSARKGAIARRLYGLPAAGIDAHRLPFRTDSFDVVISTETVEHLAHPVEAMLEMLRVARKGVLVSTCECTHSAALAWIASRLARYEEVIPVHGHINFFRGEDFRSVLGPSTLLSGQFIKPGLSRAAGRALRYKGADPERIKAHIRELTWTRRYLPGSRGVVALRVLDPAALRTRPSHDDEVLLDALLSHIVDREEREATGPDPEPEWSEANEAQLRGRLECPSCGKPQELSQLLAGCSGCSHRAEMVDGVPALLPRPGFMSAGDPFDSGRFAETIAAAGLDVACLESVKRRLEDRRGSKRPTARAALRGARRALRLGAGVKRGLWMLRERMG